MDTARARSLALAMLIAFAAVAVAGVLLRPLIPIDETRYIDVAWEMRVTGDFLVPHKNFEIYTDKPPMLFWLMNLVWFLTGHVSDIGARLVGPAFGLGAIWGSWRLGARLWDETTGAVAAAVLAGTSFFAIYGGAVMFDTMLAAATVGGLLALIAATSAPGVNRRAWAGFGLALAFGVLAKGPVILLHLGPALLTVPLWANSIRRPSGGEIARGAAFALVIALAIVGLWVVPAAILGGPEYRHMILWEQTAGRTVQSFAHARPWYWLLALTPLLFFPWAWTPSLWRGLRRLSLSDRGLRLCLIQAGAGLVLFSLVSGKQVHYLIPELPAVALIFARALIAGGRGEVRGLGALPAAVLVLLAGGAALAVALGKGDATTVAMLQPLAPVAGFAALCVILALAALVLPRVAGLATLGLGFVLALLGLIGTTGLAPAYDSTPIAQILAAHQEQGMAVVTDRYNAEFGFEGRLTKPVDVLEPEQAEGWLSTHPGGILASECKAVTRPGEPEHRIHFYGADWCLWQGR